MRTRSSPVENSDVASGFPEASFSRSADGMPVALVGGNAFAMAPGANGGHYLVTGWRIARPMNEWVRDDFCGHAGRLSDEAEFSAKVLEQVEHQREKNALGRRDMCSTAHTPWGPSQGATVYGDGIVFHTTAGHGGIHLSAERNAGVHPMLRATDGFYEEDECWAIVAITFPHLFTSFERRCAEQTIKDSFSGAWEAIFGTVLRPGESRTKDRRAFKTKHGDDWIVVSAVTSGQRRGFVECVATLGGRHRSGGEERRFLVPSTEYNVGRFGFVIDPDRHAVYDGPSSFAGWQEMDR